jgi:enoyl-[acyl-carrier protein] reductase I
MSKLLEGKRGIITGVANERSIAWGCAQARSEKGAELIFTSLGDAQEKRVHKLLETLSGGTC